MDWARAYLLRIPFVGTIYSANRQLVESFSGTSVTGFKRVVLVQFPRAGSWSLGFLTGITDADGVDRLIMTYVPTAPLPNSGFVVLMPPKDVLDTDLTVPDAMQLIFSGGIVSPRTIRTRKIDVAEVESQMRQMELPAEAITSAVGKSVSASASSANRLSVGKLRRTSAKALRDAQHRSGSVARDAMIGAVQAVGEAGPHSVDRVRDATKGVVLGVGEATGMTTRVLHDAFAGAILAGRGRDTQGATVQGAAAGTMEAAASVGIPADQAASQISRATVEALRDSEEELIEGAKATMKGVIAGAGTARNDVLAAARHSAYELVSNAVRVGLGDPGALATALAEAAEAAGTGSSVDPVRLQEAVAGGSLDAAVQAGETAADAVRSAIADRLGTEYGRDSGPRGR